MEIIIETVRIYPFSLRRSRVTATAPPSSRLNRSRVKLFLGLVAATLHMRRGNGDARRERLIVNGVGAAGSSDVRSSLDKVAAQARAEGLPPGLTLDINDDPCSSTSSIGLSGDVVPVYSDSFTRQSPRLNYLRMLSGRMVSNGLEPLEPPPGMDLAPPASVSGVFPEVGDGSQKAGSVGMIFSLWNTMMGSTLLVMPYTFNEAGWLFALLLSMLGACIAQFSCGLILHYAEGMMADPSAEFADLARLHFGALGQYVTFFTGNFVVLGAAIAMHGYMCAPSARASAVPAAHRGRSASSVACANQQRTRSTPAAHPQHSRTAHQSRAPAPPPKPLSVLISPWLARLSNLRSLPPSLSPHAGRLCSPT